MSMSCDNSDYSYAQYGVAKVPARTVENMTELLEEPVEETPEQVGLSPDLDMFVKSCRGSFIFDLMSANCQVGTLNYQIKTECNYLNKSINAE